MGGCVGLARKPVQALVCDCEGVLVDMEPARYEAWRSALNALQQSQVPYTLQDYGDRHLDQDDAAIAEDLASSCANVAGRDLLEAKINCYDRLRTECPGLGAIQLVRLAQKRHVPIVVVSVEPEEKRLRSMLLRVGLDPSYMFLANGPQRYETARQLLVDQKQDLARCVVLEDSNGGTKAARAAGFEFVATVSNAHKFSVRTPRLYLWQQQCKQHPKQCWQGLEEFLDTKKAIVE